MGEGGGRHNEKDIEREMKGGWVREIGCVCVNDREGG